jgi:hypothetical protein
MQKKIIDYHIEFGNGSVDLIRSVKILIAQGWQPYGRSFQTPSNGQFYQTMVKYED